MRHLKMNEARLEAVFLAARSSPDMINSSPQFKAWFERARAKLLEPEVRRAGLAVEKHGHQLAGSRCPICPDSGDDRFWVDIRKNTWGCRRCGKRAEDVIALVMAVSGLNFLDACERLTGERPPKDRDNLNHEEPRQGRSEPRQAVQSHDDDEARRRRALAIWHEAEDPRGTLAQTYLESRGLTLSDELAGDVLRFHAACPWREGEMFLCVPAMIALMRHVATDEPRCIQRTRLAPYGQKISRKMYGPAKGAAIKIDADVDIAMGLVIGEGLETCMAARQLGYSPAWALGSVGAVEGLSVLDGVDGLTILAEAGEPSRKAVQICFERWRAAGRTVVVRRSTIGSDINDAIRGAA